MDAVIVRERAMFPLDEVCRRALASSRGSAGHHMGAAVMAQVVSDGRFAPRGQGQSATDAWRDRAKLTDAFLTRCDSHGIDTESVTEDVTDVVVYAKCGEDEGRMDALQVLSRAMGAMRAVAQGRGYTVALGLHALEAANGGLVRDPHLHMLCMGSEATEGMVSECVSYLKRMGGVGVHVARPKPPVTSPESELL